MSKNDRIKVAEGYPFPATVDKAAQQLRALCEKFPVDFYLLLAGYANEQQILDVIMFVTDCMSPWANPEIKELAELLLKAKNGYYPYSDYKEYFWRRQLELYTKGNISDREMAAWLRTWDNNGEDILGQLRNLDKDKNGDPDHNGVQLIVDTAVQWVLNRYL